MGLHCEIANLWWTNRPCVSALGLVMSLLLWPQSLQARPTRDISGRDTQAHNNESLMEAAGGSVLIFPVYTSVSALPQAQNTRISLTNTAETTPVFVHLFFVDGVTGVPADSYLCLSANQTVSLLASDADPDVNGYVVAVATDARGCPINFNQLIGEAALKFASGHTGQLVAETLMALIENPARCRATQATAILRFDGSSYSALPRVLALSNFMSRADGNEAFLILNRIGGDLTGNFDSRSTFFMIIFDDAENPISRSSPTLGGPQLHILLRNHPFPRQDFFEQLIPSGRSGWLKLWGIEDVAVLGAFFNFNASNPAFTQGRNLHKLTLTTAASLTIPITPPNC
jgi:hypothetical protein